jgi:predicted enzyme related to lactoylglutathione lyase
MIEKIATTAVYVEDQERATDFWTSKMGFDLRRKDEMTPGVFWIEVAPPGAQSALVLYPRKLMADWESRKASIVFVCDDARKMYAELSAKGVNFPEEPKAMPFGVFVSFKDDDGNEFLLKS